jgi:hypothetical protein
MRNKVAPFREIVNSQICADCTTRLTSFPLNAQERLSLFASGQYSQHPICRCVFLNVPVCTPGRPHLRRHPDDNRIGQIEANYWR